MSKEYRNLMEKRCVPCGHNGSFYPLDPEHLYTRKARPELANHPLNIMTVCRKCHVEKGNKGMVHMANKYPNYKAWLIKNGWEFNEFLKKWVLYEF